MAIAIGILGTWRDVSVLKESFREDRIARNRMELDHKALSDKVAHLDAMVKAMRIVIKIPAQ